jgi:hypothetical protein
MRILTILAAVLAGLSACGTNPVRGHESVEQLCFGDEYPRWHALDPQSNLALELMHAIRALEPLAQRQGISRETVLVSPRQRHASICRLGALPSGKGCVAEKWILFQDVYNRWFVDKHFAEACQEWEEIVVTS